MELSYQNGILTAFVELSEVKLGQFAIIHQFGQFWDFGVRNWG